MRHITVAIPDEVYREALARATEQGRSLSALVVTYLASLSPDRGGFERLEALQREVRDEIASFTVGDRLSRDEVNDRSPG